MRRKTPRIAVAAVVAVIPAWAAGGLAGGGKAPPAGAEILEGGEDEICLGGSRLKRFMDTVEKATTAIPQPMPAHAPGSEDGETETPGTARLPRLCGPAC